MIISIEPQTAPVDVPEIVRCGGFSGSHRIPCSFFRDGVTDTTPIHWYGTWGKLIQGFLREFPFEQGVPPSVAKKSLPAICGATFAQGTTRNRENAKQVSLLLGDVDNTTKAATGKYHIDSAGMATNRPQMGKAPLESPVTMAMVAGALEAASVTAFLWSTWSSRPGNPRFRFAVPLVMPVSANAWPYASNFAIHALGLEEFLPAIDMSVLRNPSALAFLPGSIYPEYLERCFVDGDPLYINLSATDKTVTPRSILSPWQLDIIRQRSTRSGPKWWTGYLEQGRLADFHTLDLPRIMRSLGCFVGRPQDWKGGVKYRCTCPWHGEHTGGEDDDSAVVFMTPGHWPGWHCSHAGHAHMGLRDVLELAWGRP